MYLSHVIANSGSLSGHFSAACPVGPKTDVEQLRSGRLRQPCQKGPSHFGAVRALPLWDGHWDKRELSTKCGRIIGNSSRNRERKSGASPDWSQQGSANYAFCANASATRERAQIYTPAGLTSPIETNLFQGYLSVSWEVDVFGGIRRAVEAATADVAAAEDNRRNVLVILLGDAGRTYAQLRGFQRQL
jgi:hypothetical protein